MCDKKRFPSRALAIQKLDWIVDRGEHRDKMPARVYFCRKCGGYHLTSIAFTKAEKNYQKEIQKFRVIKISNDWVNKKKWLPHPAAYNKSLTAIATPDTLSK